MTDNRDEIVRLAVDWATNYKQLAEVENKSLHPSTLPARILALASPPEPPEPEKPKRFPGIDTEPRIAHNDGLWWVKLMFGNGFCLDGAQFATKAAAVAAWNAMIDRIAGPDDETVRLVGDLTGMLNHPDADVLHRARRWLAERTGGAK